MSVVGEQQQQRVLIDGSRLMIEAMARAGADTFVGYPITPANLLYTYGMLNVAATCAGAGTAGA